MTPTLEAGLDRLDERPLPPSPGGVDAFMVVRNEADRLPHVLAHHRRLGVSRFFVCDNGSSDGSLAILEAAPDCAVYRTAASFAAAGCGMDWINAMVAEHGQNRWCLFVDADEHLVYPHSDTLPLPAFCRFLDANGSEGVFALMIDMYPDGPLRDARPRPDAPLEAICPLHDADYVVRRKAAPSLRGRGFHDVEALGGVRARLFHPRTARLGPWGMTLARARRALRHSALGHRLGLDRGDFGLCPPDITKIPLMRACAGRHWVSNHRTTSLSLSPVTGALLHFKLMADFHERARTEAARGEHWGAGSEYACYRAFLDRDPEPSLAHENSRRYRAPEDLVACGAMRTTPAYEAYAAGHALGLRCSADAGRGVAAGLARGLPERARPEVS